MPSSPNSPRRRRGPSSLDLSSASPQRFAANGYGQSPPYSPQTPRTCIPQSPTMSRRRVSSGTIEPPSRFSGDFASDLHADVGGDGDAGGIGSLADELAEAWDDDAYGYGYSEGDASGVQDGEVMISIDGASPLRTDDQAYIESIHDMGIGMGGISQGNSDSEHEQLKPPRQKPKGQSRHRRHESLYDGSDYGNDSDFEDPGELSPGLEARMASIEDLVRWTTGGDDKIGVVDQFIGLLRELVGQASIENSASRLITAHTSLASHLTHQTRSLQTLTHPLLISSFPSLSSDAIDDLVSLINTLLPNLPFPDSGQHQLSTRQHTDSNHSTHLRSDSQSTPLLSLQSLLSQTSDLTHTLRILNDTVHESRQLTSTASRRLKTVRELVLDMRQEDEAREEGIRWIEKGGWDARIAEREAGVICQSVVSGFEAVCGEWRDRLFGAAEVTVT